MYLRRSEYVLDKKVNVYLEQYKLNINLDVMISILNGFLLYSTESLVIFIKVSKNNWQISEHFSLGEPFFEP